MKSLYQQHVEKWSGCTRCRLHETRCNVVLARGQLPCHVLFIGEAPGDSEDVVGAPFVGPAGNLLQQIVERALLQANGSNLRYAFTNVVACRPVNEDGAKDEPGYDEIEACSPRLQELVNIANPQLVVFVGSTARDWCKPGLTKPVATFKKGTATVSVMHPAAILRQPEAMQGLAIRRCVVQLTTALRELTSAGER